MKNQSMISLMRTPLLFVFASVDSGKKSLDEADQQDVIDEAT